jgi:hypothetical protein
MTTAESTNQGLIYQAQGILSLISRAWNLLRLNLRNSLILMLAPTLLLMFFSILIAIPASQTFLTPTLLHQLAISILLGLLAVGAGLAYFILWGFSCSALIRLYYSAIVNSEPISLKEALLFVKQVWPRLLGLMGLFVAGVFGFAVLDFLILFLGILMSTAAFAVLGSLVHVGNNPILAAMIIFFLLLWGFLVLVLLVGLMSFEGFFLMFPFIAVSTEPDPTSRSWFRSVLNSYKLVFANMPRLVLFSIALFFFSLTLSLVLNAPAFLWAFLEMTRLGVSKQHYLPMYIHVVMNLWQNLVHLLLTPFYLSAVTLFWYDCRVRKEGLDLQLWLEQLTHRRKLHPALPDNA